MNKSFRFYPLDCICIVVQWYEKQVTVLTFHYLEDKYFKTTLKTEIENSSETLLFTSLYSAIFRKT
jgi:hypothetical protein